MVDPSQFFITEMNSKRQDDSQIIQGIEQLDNHVLTIYLIMPTKWDMMEIILSQKVNKKQLNMEKTSIKETYA